MELLFNNSAAMIYDFIRIITEKYNNLDMTVKTDERALKNDPKITQIKAQIWNHNFNTTPGLSLFFKKDIGRNSFIAHTYDKRLHEFTSVNQYIDHLISTPLENLMVSLFEFYDINNNDTDFYKSLIFDKTAVFNYLMSMEQLNDKQRFEFIALYDSRSSIMEPLNKLLKEIEKQLIQIYTENNEQIREYEQLMKSKIKNNPDEILSILALLSNSSISNNNTSKVILSYSFLYEYLMLSIGKINPTVFLGINHQKILEVTNHINSSITTENFLKAFSDPARLDIIRMLNGKEMYVGEITANCKLSFSTTSYHIDILINAGILSRRMSGRRVYYKLNVEYLTQHLEIIKNSIQQNTF